MDTTTDAIANFYKTDQYARQHPTLHTEHSGWKLTKLAPLMDSCGGGLGASSDDLVVMDVGGGAGLILRGVCEHLNKSTNRRIIKYALDLSPGMLEAQQQNNPDVAKLLNEDICQRHSRTGGVFDADDRCPGAYSGSSGIRVGQFCQVPSS
jgi:hypothetical protein